MCVCLCICTCVCMHIHLCVYVCVFMWLYLLMCAHVEVRGWYQDNALLNHFFIFCLEMWSLLFNEIGLLVSPFDALGSQAYIWCCSMVCTYVLFCGSKWRSSCLCAQHLTYWNFSQSFITSSFGKTITCRELCKVYSPLKHIETVSIHMKLRVL